MPPATCNWSIAGPSPRHLSICRDFVAPARIIRSASTLTTCGVASMVGDDVWDWSAGPAEAGIARIDPANLSWVSILTSLFVFLRLKNPLPRVRDAVLDRCD